ncbi:MAG: histidine kinase [Candidatus Eisenbacteria bacterium]|nr:histidine kinase [Candidatus Eisenbacteria bacterium]
MIENPFKNLPYRNLAILIALITLFVGTLISLFTGESTYAVYIYTFVYTTACTFFISMLLGSFYRFIYALPRTYFFTSFVVLVLAGALLGTQTASLVLYRRLHVGSRIIIFSFAVSLVTSIIMVAHEHLKSTLAEKITRIREIEFENEMLKRLELEARLMSLQAKLNPHFLFNTLNALAALVYDDPKRADKNIVRLSSLYRRVLLMTERGMIPLGDEIALVRDYLELEKELLDEKLSYRIECPESVMKMRVPGLLIEPLVENAVKHRGSTDGLNVTVSAADADGKVIIKVTDNGPGFDVATASYGYGLFGVQKRLQLQYRDEYRFDIASEPGKGTTVSITIPAERAESGVIRQPQVRNADKSNHS